jgi:hypothetical protein
MGLNFFNNKFLIKSTFLKVQGHYNHHNRFTYVNIFATFVAFIVLIDKLMINSTDVFGQKINALKVKR